jgi:hypothetical protein
MVVPVSYYDLIPTPKKAIEECQMPIIQIGDDFFLGPNLVSFNQAVVPYEISKVNFRVETKIRVSMSEEI